MATYKYVINPHTGRLQKVLDDSSLETGGGGARVKVNLSSMQSIPNDVDTKINFNTEDWDLNDEFAAGTFTAKEAGYYTIILHGVILSLLTEFLVSVSILVNSNPKNSQYEKTQNLYEIHSCHTSTEIYLNIGDTVEGWVHQNSGSDKFLLGTPTPNITTLSISKL